MPTKPLLTIGMIFKNEIRCLERCMKSLEPLRKAIPCELIMADTGSDDGSEKIAEKYADILFDFPWINDFSAARNAVMDRASGEWFMALDADEWLDADVSCFADSLTAGIPPQLKVCSVVLRDHSSYDAVVDSYADFFAIRLLRMSTGLRYHGKIHEAWGIVPEEIFHLSKAIVHHDGYIVLNEAGSKRGEEKRKRNMALLREELAKDPNNPSRLLQCIESSEGKSKLKYIQRAFVAVKAKQKGWDVAGPIIFHHAVIAAQKQKLPEFHDWVQQANEQFPDSIFTRVDVSYCAFEECLAEERYKETIQWINAYLQALEDYHAGRFDQKELLHSSLCTANELMKDRALVALSDACFYERRYEESFDALKAVDASTLNAGMTPLCLAAVLNLHTQSECDMEQYIVDFWRQVSSDIPTKKVADARREAVTVAAEKVLADELAKKGSQKGSQKRPPHTLFLPLAKECELGTAAAILETESPEEIESLMCLVSDWGQFPVCVLAYALEHGVPFPLPGKRLNMEEMDNLVSRLANDKEMIVNLALRMSEGSSSKDLQQLMWLRGLMLTAIPEYSWEEAEQGMALAKAFAKVERAFLPRYYAPELLDSENIWSLPPMHRFGWYCAQAFEVLEAGRTVEYVQLLKKGLDAAPIMKQVVEFLTEHTPQLQPPPPSGELLALAEQVRAMLSAYAPDDPAVEALKASPAYQKVAHLIEGPEIRALGILAQ